LGLRAGGGRARAELFYLFFFFPHPRAPDQKQRITSFFFETFVSYQSLTTKKLTKNTYQKNSID
jgi:hypothetical protein